MSDGLLNIILGGGFSAILSILGWGISEIRKMRKEITDAINASHQRVDILDGIISDVTDVRLNSRIVIEKGSRIPRVHPNVLKIIHGREI